MFEPVHILVGYLCDRSHSVTEGVCRRGGIYDRPADYLDGVAEMVGVGVESCVTDYSRAVFCHTFYSLNFVGFQFLGDGYAGEFFVFFFG